MADSDKDRDLDKDARLHITLTRREKTELKIRAAKQGKTMSDIVRDALFDCEQRAVAA